MKLGDRVRFSKELHFHKNFTYGKEQSRTLEFKHPEEKTGIVCGVRTYPSKAILRFGGDNPDQLEVTQYQKVYLIATDLRGFHRVPEEWLELIEPKSLAAQLYDRMTGWRENENIAKLSELEQRQDWDELTEEDAKQYLRQLTGEDDDES